MINRKNLWFLTLFSLILVLGIYYITLPSEIFSDNKTKEVYANEINTIPGSLAFYLWDASGLKYGQLIDKLVDIAFRRERKRENLTFTIDTNILSGVSFGSKGSKGSKF